jgi:tetratricopeptide (TPR) repeat protein
MKVKKIIASLIVGVFAFQSSAIAQNKPSLIVSPLRGKNTKAAMDAIGGEFKKSNQVFIVDFEKILEYVKSKQTKKTKKSTKDALAAFEKGKKAYQNLNIKEAIESLEKSKMLYQDALWDEDSFQGLRTTKFHLAMAYQADKKDTQAKLELQEVILIDPSRSESTLSEKYYSPQIRELYQKVLKEVKTAEAGQVQITTVPARKLLFLWMALQWVRRRLICEIFLLEDIISDWYLVSRKSLWKSLSLQEKMKLSIHSLKFQRTIRMRIFKL